MKKLYYIFIVCFFYIESCAQEKIKLYALYTPSHEVFKDKFFVPSIQDDFELIFEFCDQTCPSVKFMEEGWTQTTMNKVNLIIRAIKENWNSIFIFSDVDIQFFAPIKDIILELIEGKDMVIQRNTPDGVLCTGFFVCRGNEKTLRLWEDVKKMMESDCLSSDQISFNRCIKRRHQKNLYGIVWDYLPHSFFGAGTLTGYEWRPGMLLPIPDNIMIHHANWTKGVHNKIAQLIYVRDEVRRRRRRILSMIH